MVSYTIDDIYSKLATMKLSLIKPNPRNPRLIKDAKFKKLVKSIKDFPQMIELRPIIVDNDNVILGGNMRYKALQELKYNDISDNWVKKASELTEEQKQEFIIKDNVSFGEYDFDILSTDFNMEELADWGLDNIDFKEVDPKDKEDIYHEKYSIIVDVANENEQAELYAKLQEMGYTNLKILSI